VRYEPQHLHIDACFCWGSQAHPNLRAAGKGRNINTDLPIGKGEGTRSDVDVKIDGQSDIDARGAISNDLKNFSDDPNHFDVRTRHSTPQPPVITIKPRNR
jgi:hypothetical protein